MDGKIILMKHRKSLNFRDFSKNSFPILVSFLLLQIQLPQEFLAAFSRKNKQGKFEPRGTLSNDQMPRKNFRFLFFERRGLNLCLIAFQRA